MEKHKPPLRTQTDMLLKKNFPEESSSRIASFRMSLKPMTAKPDSAKPILQIAVPAPLFGCFDYRAPAELDPAQLSPGCRVRVPFGRRTHLGIIIGHAEHSSVADNKLKSIQAALDEEAVFPGEMLALLNWAANYYQHPLGEVMQAALPARLRLGKALEPQTPKYWKVAEHVDASSLSELNRAPKQRLILQRLLNAPDGLDEAGFDTEAIKWRDALKALMQKNLVEEFQQPCVSAATTAPVQGPALNDEQQKIINDIEHELDQHQIHLIHGITGSGKTEVYIELSKRVLTANKQVLVLVPEISLTPQLTERFQQRLGMPVAVLHSGMNDQQRHCAWYAAAKSQARLVIGTRSAIFTPMPELGLIIVDEEHDGSYKQQEGFRYNARDLALVRAHKGNFPVVLGSATPSLESLHNANRQRFKLHTLRQRARASILPRIELVDLRRQAITEGLSATLLDKVEHHLQQNNQVLLFLNRRGFSSLLLCHACGWTTACKRCDAHMTYHKHKHLLRCHHCGAETQAPRQCETCGSDELLAIGMGTERIEQFLSERFPAVMVNRIDRDTTRRKGSLQAKLEQVHRGEAGILVGTQMLAKGHDFPDVTLVGILDTDQALFSTDFRAAEHLAQLITQVAGRAGRAEKPGEVLIQTHQPDHPLLQTLLHQGYEQFSQAALEERRQVGLPPCSHMALLRCAAIHSSQGQQFMQAAKTILDEIALQQVDAYGPLPAPMEKRAGRYRTQIILQSADRRALHQLLQQWLPQLQALKSARQIRWSIDVDPYDTY